MALDEIRTAFTDPGSSAEVRELSRRVDQLEQQINDLVRAVEARLAALEADPFEAGTPGNWASPAPTTKTDAINRLVADPAIGTP